MKTPAKKIPTVPAAPPAAIKQATTPWEVGFPSEVPLDGRWVAWDECGKRILAVADTYADLMKMIPDADGPSLVIRKAPGVHPIVAARPFTLLPEESPDIIEDVKQVIGGEYEQWLDTPHFWFAGRKPRDLIGTEGEQDLRYLLRSIRYGIPS